MPRSVVAVSRWPTCSIGRLTRRPGVEPIGQRVERVGDVGEQLLVGVVTDQGVADPAHRRPAAAAGPASSLDLGKIRVRP